jgi:Tfp pilus assembly protein PilZ
MGKFFLDKGGDVEEYTGDQEQRKHLRFPVCLAVNYHENPTQPCSDFILSISMGGVFIRTDRPFKTGSKIKMQFSIPPHIKELGEFDGKVVNVNTDNPNHPIGIFVKFINCSERELTRLEDYLEGRKHLLDDTV